MANGVLGTTRCQHHCSPDYCVIELEALWTWYAPFCKHYCTQVKSKDHAKTLFRGTFRVGRGPGGNSELCDLFKDLESNPEAKSSTRQARFWAAGFRHERVSSGLPESVQSQSHRSGALPAPNPWRQSPGEALRRRMAAGLGGPGAVWQVQVSPSASWNGGPSRSVAAARGPGAPASQLASDPIPGGDFVMSEHSCICSDDPLICARKVRILLQIPGASPSIWLAALKVSHRFQHVKPPLQEYFECEEESRPWACRWTLSPCAFYFTVHTLRASRRALGLRSLCCPALWENLSTYYLERKQHLKKCIREHLHPTQTILCDKQEHRILHHLRNILMASPRQAGIHQDR